MLKHLDLQQVVRLRGVYIFAVITYIVAIRISYEWIVAPIFEAWGFGWNDIEVFYRIAAYAIAFAPALIIPVTVAKPSELICHLQYLVIYIPCCLILNDSIRPTHLSSDLVDLNLSMLAGMLILIAMSYLPTHEVAIPKMSAKTFWTLHYLLTIALISYLLLVFGSFYVFADFEDVYSVRSSAGDIVQSIGQGFVNYATLWLASFFLPLIAARAFLRKRHLEFGLCAMGYVYLFGISGAKSFLLAPVILLVIWRLSMLPANQRGSILAGGCALLLLIPFLIPEFNEGMESVVFWYKVTINARMFSIPQLSLGQYFSFFANNPTTYLSHVRILDLFIANPYYENIPFMIGVHFYGEEVGLNVGTWAQDGLAGFGLLGIPFVSLLCGGFFWLMDSVAKYLDHKFVLVAMAYTALCFINLSLFTTVLSGGGVLLLCAFAAFPPAANGTFANELQRRNATFEGIS